MTPTMQHTTAGTVRRLGNLFDESGHSVVIAMDHGFMGRPRGFEDPRGLIKAVIGAQPDGLILTAGMTRHAADLLTGRGAPGIVMAMDQVIHEAENSTGHVEAHRPLTSVEEALRLGVDVAKTMLVMGLDSRAEQAENIAYLASMSELCRRHEVPLMVEPYLHGPRVPTDPDARAACLADGARIALEVGADILKLEYTGDKESFRAVVDASPVPVFILGGPKRPTRRETLADVVDAAECGVVGLTIGRNVWQHPDPIRMVAALRTALVDRDLERAMAVLE
jgi:DhnA family fructose-bisphosphate aldolase class Ia